VSIIHCQDIPVLADIEPRADGDVHVDLSIYDHPRQLANDADNLGGNGGIATTTQTPEPFSCHECTNCTSKSDFFIRVCGAGITMCYVCLLS
jgi:hypothetical protein